MKINTFLKQPKEVVEMTQAYVEKNNPLGQWIHDNVDITNNKEEKIKTSDFYRIYRNEVETPVTVVVNNLRNM